MFNLIGITGKIQNPRLYQLQFANRVLDRRLSRALNYYRNNYVYVKSDHILYKLIQHMVIPRDLPEEYIEQYIENKALSQGNAFGFTSDRSTGKLHYGNFYGINSTEVIIMVDNHWDWEYVKKNWENLSPVRILRHNQTHFGFNLMTSKNFTEQPGLAIIELDVHLFHMMYMAWLRHHKEIKMYNPEHKLPDIGYFLGMWVLPNALASHLNQVIINNHCLLTDEFMPTTVDYVGTSFHINKNFSDTLNNIKNTFDACRGGDWSIAMICDSVIGIGGVTAREFMDTPKVFLTRNNRWAYTLACSRFIKHCLLTPRRQDRYVNKGYTNRAKYELQVVLNGKMFNDYKIADLKPYFIEELSFLRDIK